MGSGNFGLTINQRLAQSISRFIQQTSAVAQGIRVAVPAIVQSFNPGPPATVTVTVAINEDVQWNVNGPEGPLDLQVQKMTPGYIESLGQGVLQDVPVCMPTGGGWSLTFPIQQGDECLLIFNDLEIDAWLASGGINNTTVSSRRHDLSDAIAIFGLRSTPKGLSNYSATSTQLRSDNGTVVIDLADSQITVTAPTVTVNSTTANVNASGNVNINGSQVNIEGSSQVSIDGSSNVIINGRNFLQHKHSGVASGGSTSGPVV